MKNLKEPVHLEVSDFASLVGKTILRLEKNYNVLRFITADGCIEFTGSTDENWDTFFYGDRFAYNVENFEVTKVLIRDRQVFYSDEGEMIQKTTLYTFRTKKDSQWFNVEVRNYEREYMKEEIDPLMEKIYEKV